MFGGVFGEAIFGDVVFADVAAITVPARRGRGVGGSGFPENWFEIMAQNAAQNDRQRARLEREAEEIAALVAAGVI